MKTRRKIIPLMLALLIAISFMSGMSGCGKDGGTEPTIVIARDENIPTVVKTGGTYRYTITVTGEKIKFNLEPQDIMCEGFTGRVEITEVKGNENSRVVILSNIHPAEGASKYISVAAGIAVDKHNKPSKQKTSPSFSIQP